jgi:hypothetical protein
VVIGKKNLSKYNILQENDHAPLIGLAEIKFSYFLKKIIMG